MAEKIIVHGNRLSKLKDGQDAITGYELYTGPEGDELSEDAYCGTRKVQYMIDCFPGGLRPVEQNQPNCDWDCWQLVTEVQEQVKPVACEQ